MKTYNNLPHPNSAAGAQLLGACVVAAQRNCESPTEGGAYPSVIAVEALAIYDSLEHALAARQPHNT